MVETYVSRHSLVCVEELDFMLDKFTTSRSSLAIRFPFARKLRHPASPSHCIFVLVLAHLPLLIGCAGYRLPIAYWLW